MISLKYSAAFLLLGSSLAFASPTLPPTYTGLDYLTTSGYSSSSSTCVNVDGVACGGEFKGTLGTGTTNVNPVPINFWCVDSQEDFYFGQPGLAQVVQLSHIAGDAANVRYSGVGNGDGTWTNTNISTLGNGTGSVTLLSDATTRYEMAAYLITQFPGFDTTVNGGNAESTAIEGAIWDIMSNNTPSEAPFKYFTSGTAKTDIDYWIYEASLASNYGTAAIANGFAVISWDANSNGKGLVSGANAQTFLVELTPEPGFYGALALGLSGLFFVARRRKQA